MTLNPENIHYLCNDENPKTMAKTLRKPKNEPKKETPVQLQDHSPKVQLNEKTVPADTSVQDGDNTVQLPEATQESLDKSKEEQESAQITGHDASPAMELQAESTNEIQPEPDAESQPQPQNELQADTTAEPIAELQIETETVSQSEQQSEPAPQPAEEPATESQTGQQPDAELQSETETQTESETQSETGQTPVLTTPAETVDENTQSEQTGNDGETTADNQNEDTGQNTDKGNDFQPDNLKKYLEDFRLKKDTKVISDTGTEYTVISYMDSGSYGNLYYVHNSEGEMLVLKEYCITGTKRLVNKCLDMIYDEIQLDKFINEPVRILQLFEEGKTARKVTDEMSYNVAFNTARKEVGVGGIFTWKGNTYTTYTREEKENLNLVLPRTKCFECFHNHYYVMENVEGSKLAHYMKDIQEGKIKKDLPLMLRIMEQLAIAVENIRMIPCAHLDLSPNNVMIKVEEDGRVKLKVIDFGCAVNLNKIKHSIELKESTPGSYIGDNGVGTPGFTDSTFNNSKYKMFPESIELIDMYSMGAILYYLTLFNVKWVGNYYENTYMDNDLQSINALPQDASQDKLDEFLYTPDEKQTDISEKEKELRKAILGLVKKAIAFDTNGRMRTNPFDARCQSATAFKQELQKMLCQVNWTDVKGAKVNATQTDTTLVFHTTGYWKAKLKTQDDKQPDWVSISNDKSDNGPGTITLSLKFKPNMTCSPRQATLLVQSGIWKIDVQLEQAGQTPVKADIHFPSGASEYTYFDCGVGHGELTVIASKGWSTEISPEGNGWLTVGVQGGKQGEFIVPFNVTANPSHSPRSASIILRCDDQSVEWKVQQASKPQTFIGFIGTETEHTFPSSGGQKSFRIKANGKSTVSLQPATAAAWMQTNALEFAPGEHEVMVTVMNNPHQTQREAEIRLQCGDSSIAYTIKQEKTRIKAADIAPAYTVPEEPWIPKPVVKPVEDRITPTGNKHLEFDWNDESKRTISFSCNRSWEIKMTPEVSFVKLQPDRMSGEPGNVQLTVSVDPNHSTAGRMTEIEVTAGKATCNFTVNQHPREFLKPVPQYLVFYATGQRQELDIHVTKKWKVVIPPEDRQWLRVDIPNGETGQYRLVVTADPNPDTNLRTAMLTIEAEKEKRAVVVSQPGKRVYTETSTGTGINWKKGLVAVLAAIIVGVGIWFLTGKEALPKTYALDFPDGRTLEIPHEGIEKGTWTLTANDLWKAEVVEQQPDGWLSLQRSSGDKSATSFQYSAPMNRSYTPKEATIKVICGDASKLIRVTQDFDQAHWLQTQIMDANSGKTSFRQFTKKLSNWFTLYELDPATGQKQTVKDNIDKVLRNQIPAIQIGETHDVVSFEEDTKGLIKSITLKKRK